MVLRRARSVNNHSTICIITAYLRFLGVLLPCSTRTTTYERCVSRLPTLSPGVYNGVLSVYLDDTNMRSPCLRMTHRVVRTTSGPRSGPMPLPVGTLQSRHLRATSTSAHGSPGAWTGTCGSLIQGGFTGGRASANQPRTPPACMGKFQGTPAYSGTGVNAPSDSGMIQKGTIDNPEAARGARE